MMLLGIHIIGISVIIAVTWSLAFSAGKQAGLRQAELERELEAEGPPPESPQG